MFFSGAVGILGCHFLQQEGDFWKIKFGGCIMKVNLLMILIIGVLLIVFLAFGVNLLNISSSLVSGEKLYSSYANCKFFFNDRAQRTQLTR